MHLPLNIKDGSKEAASAAAPLCRDESALFVGELGINEIRKVSLLLLGNLTMPLHRENAQNAGATATVLICKTRAPKVSRLISGEKVCSLRQNNGFCRER
jgi:hypothetical protein